MIYSMTGFCRVTQNLGNFTATVEIRSLNSRNLDLKLRLPASYREKEMDIRRICDTEIMRGKVDFNIEVDYPDGSRDALIDRAAFLGFYRDLSALAEETGLSTQNLLNAITRLPNVVTTGSDLVDEEEWQAIKPLIDQAIKGFREFRRRDGQPIEADFRLRVGLILEALEAITPFEGGRVERIRAKLLQNLEEWAKAYVDENRLEQELIYYLEKFDISEEKLRLRQHCDFFLQELANDDPAKGRKLGFIAQEMGREINTIGSKANATEIQKLVVGMKDELEKIKEQLANIL